MISFYQEVNTVLKDRKEKLEETIIQPSGR